MATTAATMMTTTAGSGDGDGVDDEDDDDGVDGGFSERGTRPQNPTKP